MSCNKCNKEFPIVNKKYNMCDSCNYIRLNGKSKQETYADRASSKGPKIYVFKRSVKPMRQQTTKEAGVKNKLAALKRDIELEAVQSDTYYCWGCGCSQMGLDKSHVLSVGQFKHLELDRDNINLFCRTCHMDWESSDIVRMGKLLTFEKDTLYVQANSEEYFNKIVYKMREYNKWNDDKLTTLFNRIIAKTQAL